MFASHFILHAKAREQYGCSASAITHECNHNHSRVQAKLLASEVVHTNQFISRVIASIYSIRKAKYFGIKQSAFVLKVGVAHIEYRPHKACIEVATRSIVVYKVGVALTEYIKCMKLVLK